MQWTRKLLSDNRIRQGSSRLLVRHSESDVTKQVLLGRSRVASQESRLGEGELRERGLRGRTKLTIALEGERRVLRSPLSVLQVELDDGERERCVSLAEGHLQLWVDMDDLCDGWWRGRLAAAVTVAMATAVAAAAAAATAAAVALAATATLLAGAAVAREARLAEKRRVAEPPVRFPTSVLEKVFVKDKSVLPECDEILRCYRGQVTF